MHWPRFAANAFAMLLAFISFAEPSNAQTKMDCSRLYKEFWEKMEREKFAKILAKQLAA